MSASAAERTLEVAAAEFADELSNTVRGVLGSAVPRFVAERAPSAQRAAQNTRVLVRAADSRPVPLKISGQVALELLADFRCQWDHRSMYLAVSKAAISVRPIGVAEPLFRYEFESEMQGRLPTAHMHIHAHRDEFLYQLFRGEKGKAKTRAAALESSGVAPPRLSNLHFPLGGARLRPCVEDILEFLIVECSVDATNRAQQVIDDGRVRWRKRQIAAAVRDAPEQAARVLRELNYDVQSPPDGPASDRLERLAKP